MDKKKTKGAADLYIFYSIAVIIPGAFDAMW